MTPPPLDDPRFDRLSDRARGLYTQARNRLLTVSCANRAADEIVAAGLGWRESLPNTKMQRLRVVVPHTRTVL